MHRQTNTTKAQQTPRPHRDTANVPHPRTVRQVYVRTDAVAVSHTGPDHNITGMDVVARGGGSVVFILSGQTQVYVCVCGRGGCKKNPERRKKKGKKAEVCYKTSRPQGGSPSAQQFLRWCSQQQQTAQCHSVIRHVCYEFTVANQRTDLWLERKQHCKMCSQSLGFRSPFMLWQTESKYLNEVCEDFQAKNVDM